MKRIQGGKTKVPTKNVQRKRRRSKRLKHFDPARMREVSEELQQLSEQKVRPINTSGRYKEKGQRKFRPNTKSFSDFLKKICKSQRSEVMDLIRDPYKDVDKVPDAEEVHKLFPKPGEVDNGILSAVIQENRAETEVSTSPFTMEKVKLRMKKCTKSSPGIDGTPYSAWKRFDPSLKVVYEICNIALSAERIPTDWRLKNCTHSKKGKCTEI